MQFAPLEREGLLVVGANGTATVAPLDADELESMLRFARLVLPGLHARSVAYRGQETVTRSPETQEWLPADLAQYLPANPGGDRLGEVSMRLVRGIASEVEIQQVTLLYSSMGRYQRLGLFGVLSGPALAHGLLHELSARFAGLATPDPAVACEHAHRVADHVEELARRSLRVAEADGAHSRTFAGKSPLLKLV